MNHGFTIARSSAWNPATNVRSPARPNPGMTVCA